MSDSFAAPWTVARQAPLSMGFSRQECWSGLPFPFPGDLPDRGIQPTCPALAGGFFATEPPGKPQGQSWVNTINVKYFISLGQNMQSLCFYLRF